MDTPQEANRIYLPADKTGGEETPTADPIQAQASETQGQGNIEKVRDILFGSQMRDVEKRFTRLEDRLIREIDDLRGESRRRIDSLENYIKKEVESLSDRLKAEQDERTEAVKRESESLGERLRAEKEDRLESIRGMSKEVKEISRSLEKKIAQLDDQFNKSAMDLRQQILDQSKNLSDEIRQKHEETIAKLERVAQELGLDKVDRTALSEFFMEMAMRLTNDSASRFHMETDDSANE